MTTEAYLPAIKKHINEVTEKLDKLAAIINERQLNDFEYAAAERYLQVLVEAAIGISKHWLKSKSLVIPVDAYSCFEKLIQEGFLEEFTFKEWRSVIGLRNLLVHDYLNINPEVVEHVVSHKEYQIVQKYAVQAEAKMTT